MATGTVRWFNGSKGYGFITLDGGGDVFVHVKDVLLDGGIRDGQRVEFEVEQTKKGPKAVAVRELGQDLPILGVRQVAEGKKGPAIVRATGSKIILPGSGLKDLPSGTPVAITGFEERPQVIIASGFSLAERMVVRCSVALGYGGEAIIMGETTVAVPFPKLPEGSVEVRTELNRTSWSAGQTYGGYLSYYLINKGYEEEVRRAFTWSAFLAFLDRELGLYDILKLAPAPNVPDEELAVVWSAFRDTPELVLFRPSDDRQPVAGHMIGRDEALREIIQRHLAPMVIFTRRLARGEVKADAGDLWGQHRETFCDQFGPAEVTAEAVIQFLLETESKFPGPDDGLEELGPELVVAEARAWSRGPEVQTLLQQANELARKFRGVFPGDEFKASDLAWWYVELGRTPVLEDLAPQQAIEEKYPSRVEVPGIGERPVNYPDWPFRAEIGLTPEEVLQMEAMPAIPGQAGVWIKSPYGEGDRLDKVQEATREGLLREAFAAAVSNLPLEDPEWWVDEGDNPLPSWPEPRFLGEVPGVGLVEVWPTTFQATAQGIRTMGWTRGAAVSRARESFEQALAVWQARRGELPAVPCPKCGGPMAGGPTGGENQEHRLKCSGCGHLPEYPVYRVYHGRGRKAVVYLGHSHTGEGTSFDLTTGGYGGVETFRRRAALEELDRVEVALGQLGVQTEGEAEAIRLGRDHMLKTIGQVLAGEFDIRKAGFPLMIDLLTQFPELQNLPFPVVMGDRGDSAWCHSARAVAEALVHGKFMMRLPEGSAVRDNAPDVSEQYLPKACLALVHAFLANFEAEQREYLASFDGDPRWKAIRAAMDTNSAIAARRSERRSDW